MDFAALRAAFLASPSAGGFSASRNELLDALDAGLAARDPAAVRAASEALVRDLWTDPLPHFALRGACETLGDSACAEKQKFIADGLFDALLASGDGRSCGTGWIAVSVAEEYSVMQLGGIVPGTQALVQQDGHTCDMFEATSEGKTAELYFQIDGLYAAEARAFTK